MCSTFTSHLKPFHKQENYAFLSLTFRTYDGEKDGDKDGGSSYYDDLKKELSAQGQVSPKPFCFCASLVAFWLFEYVCRSIVLYIFQ